MIYVFDCIKIFHKLCVSLLKYLCFVRHKFIFSKGHFAQIICAFRNEKNKSMLLIISKYFTKLCVSLLKYLYFVRHKFDFSKGHLHKRYALLRIKIIFFTHKFMLSIVSKYFTKLCVALNVLKLHETSSISPKDICTNDMHFFGVIFNIYPKKSSYDQKYP